MIQDKEEYAKKKAVEFGEALRTNLDIYINPGNEYDTGFRYYGVSMNAEELYDALLKEKTKTK